MQEHVTLVKKYSLSLFDKNKNYRKAKDHCFFTGRYRGAAHSICNLGFKFS